MGGGWAIYQTLQEGDPFFCTSNHADRAGVWPGCALPVRVLLAHSRAPDYFLPARIPAGAGAGRHLSGPLHHWPLPVVNQDSSINVDNKTTRRPCAYNQPYALRLHLSSCLRKGVDCAAQRLWQRWRAAISKQGTVQASLRSPRRRCQIPVPAPRPRRGWTRRAA